MDIYCIPDICSSNQYCCGKNECCSNFSLTIITPYVILGILLLVAILAYWVWLLLRKRRTNSMKICDFDDEEPLMKNTDIRTVD